MSKNIPLREHLFEYNVLNLKNKQDIPNVKRVSFYTWYEDSKGFSNCVKQIFKDINDACPGSRVIFDGLFMSNGTFLVYGYVYPDGDYGACITLGYPDWANKIFRLYNNEWYEKNLVI